MSYNLYNHYLEQMAQKIESHLPWETFEKQFFSIAINENPNMVREVKRMDLIAYQTDLKNAFIRAVKLAKKKGDVPALYFEFDCLNGFRSAFFLCEYYRPRHMIKDDLDECWASEFRVDDIIEGPRNDEFSKIYCSEVSEEMRAWLVAMIYTFFGKIFAQIRQRYKLDDIAICIGIHDGIIARIQEVIPVSEKLYDKNKVTQQKIAPPLTALELYVSNYYYSSSTNFLMMTLPPKSKKHCYLLKMKYFSIIVPFAKP